MKFAHITFRESVRSPKNNTEHHAYGHEPDSFNGGYDIEEKAGWVHVTWPSTGATVSVPASGVRSGCPLVADAKAPLPPKGKP